MRRNPSHSRAVKTEVVFPNDANPMGILQGGTLVKWMDIAAAVTAQTHSGYICVTASIHTVNFIAPARIGDILLITSTVTRTFNTSMEILATAAVRNIKSGKLTPVADALFSFVALNDQGKPTTIPEIIPKTETEKKLFAEAGKRKFKSEKK